MVISSGKMIIKTLDFRGAVFSDKTCSNLRILEPQIQSIKNRWFPDQLSERVIRSWPANFQVQSYMKMCLCFRR